MLGNGMLQGLLVTARNLIRSYFDPECLTNSQVTALLWLVAAAIFLWRLPRTRKA